MLGKCILDKLAVFLRQTSFGISGSFVSLHPWGVGGRGHLLSSILVSEVKVSCFSPSALKYLAFWNFELKFSPLALMGFFFFKPGIAVTHPRVHLVIPTAYHTFIHGIPLACAEIHSRHS